MQKAQATVKIEFGRGCGRASGLYRAYEKRADPNWRQREDRKEEAAEAHWEERAQEAREREAGARQSREREQREKREQASGKHEQQQRERDQTRQTHREEGRRRHDQGLDFDRMRLPSWAAYEAAFAAFKAQALASGSFCVAQVPLPPKGMVVEDAESAELWHKNLQRATLRWHPDKWARFEQMLVEPVDKEQLKQLTEGMFRSVTRAKMRGFGHTRFPARSASMWND